MTIKYVLLLSKAVISIIMGILVLTALTMANNIVRLIDGLLLFISKSLGIKS